MQGSCSDIALPALLQTLCTSLGRAKLDLRQNGEKGTICIDRGNVFDAAIGSLRGEEAFYQLFSWDHATFRTAKLLEAKQRTIVKPWTQLLLESTVHIDEASRRETEDHDCAADLALEEELLDVLAGCERPLQRLRKRKVSQQPLKALEILQDLLDELLGAAPRILEGGRVGCEPPWVTEITENTTSPVTWIQWREGRACLSTAIRRYRQWRGAKAQRWLTFQELCRSLVAVLEQYLALPSDRFGTAEMTESWQETYRLFLGELSTCLEDIEF